MPPLLANDLEYSSVSIERHTPTAPLPPKGPSPLIPVNMFWNIELRNTASKSCDVERAFASFVGVSLLGPRLLMRRSTGLAPGADKARALVITSPRCRLGSRLLP